MQDIVPFMLGDQIKQIFEETILNDSIIDTLVLCFKETQDQVQELDSIQTKRLNFAAILSFMLGYFDVEVFFHQSFDQGAGLGLDIFKREFL